MNAEEIRAAIHVLAQELKVPAERLFDAARHRAMVEGVLDVLFGLLLVVVPIVAVRYAWRWLKTTERNFYDDKGMGVFIGSAVGMIAAVFGVVMIYTGALAMLTPDYAALDQIARLFKGGA